MKLDTRRVSQGLIVSLSMGSYLYSHVFLAASSLNSDSGNAS